MGNREPLIMRVVPPQTLWMRGDIEVTRGGPYTYSKRSMFEDWSVKKKLLSTEMAKVTLLLLVCRAAAGVMHFTTLYASII